MFPLYLGLTDSNVHCFSELLPHGAGMVLKVCFYYFPHTAIWTRWIIWNCCWAPSYFTAGKESLFFNLFPKTVKLPTREIAAVQNLPFSTSINDSGFHKVLISKWTSISEHLYQSLKRGFEWRKRWNHSYHHSSQMRSHLLLSGQNRPSAIDLQYSISLPFACS